MGRLNSTRNRSAGETTAGFLGYNKRITTFSNNATRLWPVTHLPRKKESPSLIYFPSLTGAWNFYSVMSLLSVLRNKGPN